jgi:proteasome accessory factor C
VLSPTSCARRRERSACCTSATSGFEPARRRPPLREAPPRALNGRGEAAIRPSASPAWSPRRLLIDSPKGERLQRRRPAQRLELTDEELQETSSAQRRQLRRRHLRLYAEIQGDEIEVDSEPYGDNFARPARLLPLEAKALIAAIDLFGDHLPQGGLQSAREKIVKRARPRPLRGGARRSPPAGGGDTEIARS